MAKNIKDKIKKDKQFSYLQKDFESFRKELILYSKQHYSDKIVDFSESSLSGLFVDLAAYIGDNLSFYLDHQFSENFLETAIEPDNLERLIRDTGTPINGPAPSVGEVELSIIIPAIEKANGLILPDENFLPKIKAGSIFSSTKGVDFTLLDDVDFAKKDINGNFLGSYEVATKNRSGEILELSMKLTGVCTSAKNIVDTFSFGENLKPFRTIVLPIDDVIEIISVIDSNNEEYYEVKTLSQDVVFKRYENTRIDIDMVPERLEMIPAPRRFTSFRSGITGKTVLQFGSGDESVFDEDVIPDPSLHAIKLYGDRKTFNDVAIDPNSFLKTNTLGISPRNTTLTIRYRTGGGLEDNVSAGQINVIKNLVTDFKESVNTFFINKIRNSVEVINNSPTSGGENEPTLEALRNIALLSKNSQERIVTREDLLARIYSMPANFGRVFRAAIGDNPNNPLSAQLYVISRNPQERLVLSPDTLKENLAVYLNKFRLISDSIDILDAKIINLGLDFEVSIRKGYSKNSVLQTIKNKLINYFNIENFQIDQPIILGELENIILNCNGVMSILSFVISNKSGIIDNKLYSQIRYSVARSLDRGILFPPKGGIFEIRYLKDDIKGKCI